MSLSLHRAAATPPRGEVLSLTDLIDRAAGLMTTGNDEAARVLYRAWIARNPQHALLYVAHFNCSIIDSKIGDTHAAVEALKRAIALNGDFLPAYINLGSVFDRAGGTKEALGLWQTAVNRALQINGSSVTYITTALRQMARVLSDRQELTAAEKIIEQCLDLNPNQPDVMEQYIALRLAQCKWPVVEGRESIDRKTLVGKIHPLSMEVYTDDPLLQLATAAEYSRRSIDEDKLDFASDRRNAPIPLNERRLRVGYISSDLRDHAMGYLLVEFFELHNKNDIETFAYYCGPPSTSPLTSRIKAAFEHWTDIAALSDGEAAQKIAADGIDILVDVNGHTRDSRTGVYARRPAPVQVNWLGYPGSMGTPYHHYIVADDWIIPPESEIYYSEKVVRLPCYQSNDRKRVIGETPSRAQAGLPEKALVFCCFNGTHKIARFTFTRWMKILAGVPGSVLWLLDASEETKARLGDAAEALGIARERLIFAPKQANAQHLARYQLADLVLDTAPYGAHTTATDALWCGVPVLTLSGRSFASRVCGSLVRSAGLPELVCTNADAYVALAIKLGNDRAAIARHKKKLQKNRDTALVFDMDRLTAAMEQLYRTMASDHNAGRTPEPNLANLAVYKQIGTSFDHEQTEMLTVPDYETLYKTQLERRHRIRPFAPDGRLWSEASIKAPKPARPRAKRKAAE